MLFNYIHGRFDVNDYLPPEFTAKDEIVFDIAI
jgi:hypothetical protein